MRVPYTLSDQSITVFVNGKMRTVLAGNKNFETLKAHLREGEHDANLILKLSDREETVRQSAGKHVEVIAGTVYYKGEEVHNALSDKLLDMIDQGFDATPWAKFLEKLMANPSYRSRTACMSSSNASMHRSRRMVTSLPSSVSATTGKIFIRVRWTTALVQW